MDGPGPAMQTYTLTQTQIDALEALPPGLYLVCARCLHFHPSNGTLYFENVYQPEPQIVCEFCHEWGHCLK